jgi:hypothetical protein
MCVDITDPSAHQTASFDEIEHFLIGSDRCGWQPSHQCKNGVSVRQIATGKFTDNEWMVKTLPLPSKVIKCGSPQCRWSIQTEKSTRIMQDQFVSGAQVPTAARCRLILPVAARFLARPAP